MLVVRQGRWYSVAVVACAAVVSASCSNSEYLVIAGHPTAQATTDEVGRCTALHQVKSAEEDKSSPPVNIRAVVADRKPTPTKSRVACET